MDHPEVDGRKVTLTGHVPSPNDTAENAACSVVAVNEVGKRLLVRP